jgi:hypothetical protein
MFQRVVTAKQGLFGEMRQNAKGRMTRIGNLLTRMDTQALLRQTSPFVPFIKKDAYDP